MSGSTSELRVRLPPCNRFKLSSKIILLTILRQYFFCGSFVLFMSCVYHAPASVFCCVVVTCLKGVTSWLLFVMFYCVFVTFLCGILGQVWNLIVSIPDLATFLTFFTEYGHIAYQIKGNEVYKTCAIVCPYTHP